VDGGRLVTGRHGRGRKERRKFEWREKKITGILWSFHVQIHVGTYWLGTTSTKVDMLACHISETGKFECVLE
jgi:hypothetical protein